MRLTLNGTVEELPDGALLPDLLARHGHTTAARGVAIAHNGAVVPRAEWPTQSLADGDVVELLVAVQGG
ncbi:MAG: sulfur carrier protein [Frankiaceae bacterium]|nr:sulfur carrier protein [Frankiaceae bacterium]